MTREEAIEAIKCNWPDSRYTILREALDMAISALRQQEHFREVTKKVEPLTLDDLRQMDGEPVWVSVSNNWRESGVSEGWCIVRFHSKDDRVRVYVYDTRHGARFFAQQDYGESWLAYRQKPEEGDGMICDDDFYACKCPARKEDGRCVSKFPCSHKVEPPKPPTNADRIRAMTDEELAEFLWNFNLADVSTGKMGEFGPHMFRYRLKEWLQMPAEEDKHETD